MRQSITRRRLQDEYSVYIEIFFASTVGDPQKAVREDTSKRSHKQEVCQNNKGDHQWRPEYGIDFIHDVESQISRTKENSRQNINHLGDTEGIVANKAECCQEAEIKDDDQDHELDEVLAHLFETGDQGSPVGTQAQDRTDARDHEQCFEGQHVERPIVQVRVILNQADDS